MVPEVVDERVVPSLFLIYDKLVDICELISHYSIDVSHSTGTVCCLAGVPEDAGNTEPSDTAISWYLPGAG